ncbi:MAG TPA: hypothetical protein VFI31_26635 [Pirellulales bacterium]|nr:hypothetical protein [Pirellulales bacterium]
MSSFIYTVTFLPEQRKEERYSPLAYYRLPDGVEIRIHTALVWCNRCRVVTWGEHLPTLEEIDDQRAGEDVFVEHFSQLIGDFLALDVCEQGLEEYRADLRLDNERRRQWLFVRQAKPRCLDCGSTDIIGLPLNEETLIPTASTSVVVTLSGRYSGDHTPRIFDPDGEPLSHREHRPIADG